MHDCEKFREELTDQILEGKLVEVDECLDCADFYQEALAVVGIVDLSEVPPPDLSEEYWVDFNSRLRRRLLSETPQPSLTGTGSVQTWRWVAVAVAVALVVGVTTIAFRAVGSFRGAQSSPTSSIEIDDEHIRGMDPVTIEFLGQSELFLRNFVKIEPTDLEDLEDARSRARLQLAGLNQRKDAVVDFTPVQIVLDDYETVLRDIGNLDQASAEDIADVQGRIERNGLIASMKAYQPRIVVTTEQ